MTPSESPSATAIATLQAGVVAIVLDKSDYASGDIVTATILNGLDHTIYAEDHQTNCTVLVAEQQADASWQQVGRCLQGSVTHLVPIAASSQTQVQLQLMADSSGGGSTAWQAGAYRVVLTYMNTDTDAVVVGTTVYSASFTFS